MPLNLGHLHRFIDVEERIARYRRERQQPEQVNLSTAENVLLFDFYQQTLFDYEARPPITETDLRYPSSIYGSDAFRTSWAQFLNQAWGAEDLLTKSDVYAVGGTSAALECLAFILGKPGELVMAPAPLWYGFPWSFTQRPQLGFQTFDMTAAGFENFTLTLEDVQRAYQTIQPTPKFLVLTNPGNPLGGNFPEAALNEIYGWVLDYTDMHIISDEIYFLSQVGGGEPFTPAFTLDAVTSRGDVGRARVHTVWGLAKDFGMSGFKVGFVISKNADVQAKMAGASDYKTMSWFSPFDSLKQYTLSPLFLNDAGTADPTLAQEAMAIYAGSGNDALLKQQYVATAEALNAGHIQYYESNHSAIFFWLDLREFLNRVPESYWRDAENLGLHPDIDPAEEALANYISSSSGVDLIPGQKCYCRDPGYFRMCYTAEPQDKVVAGITRMAEALHRLPPAISSV